VQASQKAVTDLNQRCETRFQGDKSKGVLFSTSSPTAFELKGNTPSFSMSVTFDEHKVSLSGTRLSGSTSEGRSDLLIMDIDEGGNPCFKTVDERRIGLESACRYVFEL